MTSDKLILELLNAGRLAVDKESGLAYAAKSNTPQKPLGALTAKGYLRTSINYQGGLVCPMIHRIIWVAEHGLVLPGFVIDHINGDKTDNRLCNLESVTNAENIRRAKILGAFDGFGGREPNAPRDSRGRYAKVEHRGLPE